jgi:hypothetical protein
MELGKIACALLLGASTFACASPEQCTPLTLDLKAECGTVEACCTDDACRYVSSAGPEWSCDGTTCDGAAMELARECANLPG